MSNHEITVTANTIQEVPLDLCHPDSRNKMRPLTDEFTESLRNVGQKQPGLLRPHPEIPGEYLIVYGHRRHAGLTMAGKPFLLAVVREMTAAEANLERAIENEHRAPLSWQQKAELIEECLQEGARAEDIAEALGVPAKQVRRTAQLLRLSSSWRQAIADQVLPKWGPGHFEPFAFLAEEAQEALFQDLNLEAAKEWTAQQVEKWVADQAGLLKAFPWNLDDDTLDAAAGACSACSLRSSCNPDLFSETPGLKPADRCLNTPCQERKYAAWLERGYAKAVAKYGRVVKISKEYVQTEDELPPGKWLEAKKADEGAVAAFVVRGAGLGKVEWVTLPGTRKGGKGGRGEDDVGSRGGAAPREGEAPADTAEGPRRGRGRPTETEEVKRAKLEERRWAMALEMLRECIELEQYTKVFMTTEVVAMAVAFGVQSTSNNGEPWKALERMAGWEKVELRKALLAQVNKAVVVRLLTAEDTVAEGRRAAGLYGIDVDALKASADQEIKTPASWGKDPYQAVAEKGDDSLDGLTKDAARRRGEDPEDDEWANIKDAEVPDLLFRDPAKQAAFVFLKQHPGKDFESFQVVTGNMTTTAKQFWEVEEAISARIERLRKKAAK